MLLRTLFNCCNYLHTIYHLDIPDMIDDLNVQSINSSDKKNNILNIQSHIFSLRSYEASSP